ncbi:hypothetical protein BRC75_08040 [Halobacteriales archaeon QH_7_69_31]|nr:MAG: hypothetical protein BRC75_08040 [Halobacteriales archaeon QH_7_69_31]
MLRAALSYPTRNPDGPRSVLIGGGLVFLASVFGATSLLEGPVSLVALLGVLPWLALRGYYVRVLRTSIGRDRPTPPPLADGGRLLRDGAVAVGISAAYLLPGAVVLGPLVYARAVGTDVGTLYAEVGLQAVLADAVLSATGFLALLAAMYLLGALYATPVAVARFAYEDHLGAAFELRRVVDGALTEDYAVAWAAALLLQVLLFPIAYVFRAAIVGFFFHFVVAVAVRYCYARGVGEGSDLEPLARTTDESAGAVEDPTDIPTSATSAPEEGPAADADPTDRGTGSDPADTDRDPHASTDDAPTTGGHATTTDDHAPTSDTESHSGDDTTATGDAAPNTDDEPPRGDGEGERT